MAQHNFISLMRRLSAAGFKREFARVAVLPEWWDPSCEEDASLLPDVEIRIARFIGAPLTVVRDPAAALVAPAYKGAQLRRVRDINKDRLAPAIHAALRVGAAVIRNMKAHEVRMPPADPFAWRQEMLVTGRLLQLDDVLADLWKRGIPVVHIEELPAPSFQGLACIVEGRPVVTLGHDFDEPGRLAHFVAHETAHIVNGDCAADRPVVDEQGDISDDHEMERRAEEYAAKVMTGGATMPVVNASGFKDLAIKAAEIEEQGGVHASAIIWAWASTTLDYSTATLAAQALYLTKGGKRQIRSRLDQNVDVEGASESDRALLRCLFGDPQRNAASS